MCGGQMNMQHDESEKAVLYEQQKVHTDCAQHMDIAQRYIVGQSRR
jgi:hypothetical protein